ncbi:flocculation protein FLO11-like [Chiloscyllium plagiosum]|uniref:flocculation protein FLO11-like n=1 Tax=Chiloscyllium plagiosum TaxID=36176 RepID=UPI001CB8333E|nr:flocculation protein FLO11-like [Chiloscyllium plagiosum]
MKWQHYPKIYFPLLTILVTIGGLFGAPVDEDIMNQLLSVNTPAEAHTSEELSITPSLSAHSSISTATGDWKPEFPHTDRSLAATVGLSIDNRETGLQSEGMESVSEETSTSNKRSLNLVTVQPTEMVSSYFVPFTRKAQAKHINMISTTPHLMESSTGPTTEISSGDGKLTWHRELTVPIMSSTQSPISSVGSTLPSVPGDLPSSSVLDHALPVDEMELSTISSEHAESSAYKFVSVEQTITPGSESTNESTLPVFSIESTVAANTSSITSALFMQLSTSWSSDSTGSPNNAQGNQWQATHASMDVYTTAPSSIGTNDPSPDVSEDGHSTASSNGSNWLYSDVSEDMYSTAPSIGTNNPSLDVLADVYSTTRSSIGTNWPSPDVSESIYSTTTSSIGANYPSPDVSEDMYSTAPSIGSNWLSSDVSDMYSTAASIRTNYPSPNVAEDMYFVSIGANYQSSDVSDVYSTARSSTGSNWPSPDVSESMYSTAPSSIGANYPSPDVSEDVYSTPSSSIGTNWPPSVSEGEHCTSVATTWSSSTSVEFSTALPYGQPSIGKDIATTSEFPGDSEYFSRTSSTPNFQPSVSGAESVSSNWEQSISEELSTSMDSTSYMAPQTSSIIGSYLKTSDPGMQLFTMTTSGLEPEGSSLTIESSQTASYTHSSVIRNPLQLQFEILNQNYTDTLSNKSSEAYKELEAMVKATLDPIFSARYGDSFLETKILSFAINVGILTVLNALNEGIDGMVTKFADDTKVPYLRYRAHLTNATELHGDPTLTPPPEVASSAATATALPVLGIPTLGLLRPRLLASPVLGVPILGLLQPRLLAWPVPGVPALGLL